MTDTIIMPIESTWESIKRDVFTVASCWMLILPGWFIGSDAAQWVGSVMFAITLLSRAASLSKKHRCTLDDARHRIVALIAERDGK